MTDDRYFMLRKRINKTTAVDITKSYDFESVKYTAQKVLSQKEVWLEIVNEKGVVLWQQKSGPSDKAANPFDK